MAEGVVLGRVTQHFTHEGQGIYFTLPGEQLLLPTKGDIYLCVFMFVW